MRKEQRQAVLPDTSGVATRDGVSLHFDVYGDGPVSVLLMPTWSIVSSRIWKAQVPYLARRHRVITFDGRGAGKSGRPRGAHAYAEVEFAEDARAVLDATATERAVVVGFSCGSIWGVHLAAAHPDRVQGLFSIAPACAFADHPQEHQRALWERRVDQPRGWDTYTRHNWLHGDLAEFRAFYFGEMYCEPHSTKHVEDALLWSDDADGQMLVDSTAARLGADGVVCAPMDDIARGIRCPVHVVHGTDDRLRPVRVGERLAELTGGTLTVLEGAGHGPLTRDPVRVNTLLSNFIAHVAEPAPPSRHWTRASRRRRRVLYLSSPIGLGHARRDLAIADELRKARTDLDIMWVAQPPVTRLLDTAGEHVHPASRYLLGEAAHIEHEAGEHDLHAFEAIRRMDEIMVANFMLFTEVIEQETPDLVIADEAWEVDYFLHENPELKRYAFAWLTDFVGWLPMPDGGAREAALTADYNAEMLEHRARFPRLRDRSIFVGNPDDVLSEPFGPGLPDIREWTTRNFEFSGYVQGAPPLPPTARRAVRQRFGAGEDDRLCVVTVGGTAVGDALLRRTLDAVALARRAIPELRFIIVAGPRIDPATLPRTDGAVVRGFEPDLPDLLAACDVAVVQGGLATCMELTAAGTPFVYIPLEHHFEQNFHVRHRLGRYGAGRHLAYADACDPDRLAAAIVTEVRTPPSFRPVETDGAARAAGLLADLV